MLTKTFPMARNYTAVGLSYEPIIEQPFKPGC